MKKLFLISILALLGKGLVGQSNSYFNEFFDNAHFNSAYNTLHKGLGVSFLGYKNLSSPYTPGYFCLNSSYTTKDNLNFGVRLLNKSFQFLSYYQADAVVGHRVALSSHDSMAISLNVGGAMNTFDRSFLNQYTEVDPYLDVQTSSYFTSGAGILYTHKDMFEISASAPVLATSKDGLKPLTYFCGAYNIRANDFSIRPQVIYQQNRYANYFDFSAQLTYNKTYWAKFSYNTLNSSMFGIGVHFRLIDVGYSYKLNSETYGRALPNIHFLYIALKH